MMAASPHAAASLGVLACLAIGCADPGPPVAPVEHEQAPAEALGEQEQEQAPVEPEAADAQAQPSVLKSPELELSFVGDIVLGRYRQEHERWVYREMAAPEADPFAEVSAMLAADVVVGNLESPLIGSLPEQSPIKHRNRFGAGSQHVQQLLRGGFTVLSMANNHHYDLGVEGQREGPQLLAEAGLMAIGAPREAAPGPRVETLEVQGWRVGFLAFSTIQNHGGKTGGPKIPRLSLTAVKDQLVPLLEAARDEHDLLVVVVHWGEEYAAEIRTTQRIAAHKLLAAGADLLVGHHPHVLQAIERHASGPEEHTRDGLIAYSLGNFLFPRNDGGAELSAILSARYLDMGEGRRPCLDSARVDPIYMSRQPSWRPIA